MWSIFKSNDIVNFAVQVEKNGREFYQSLAERVNHTKAKELLLFLADEEANHINDFERILARLGEYHSPESYTGEYQEYMQTLVENHVFHERLNLDELSHQLGEPVKAIDLALQFEKDSILFFNEMKNFVPKGEHKAIDELIAQEREHIRRLGQIKKEL